MRPIGTAVGVRQPLDGRGPVTVGIDLAAQDRDTASCRIDWGPDGPVIAVRVLAAVTTSCSRSARRPTSSGSTRRSGGLRRSSRAALRRWGLRPPASYKGRDGGPHRAEIVRGLPAAARVPELSDEVVEICGDSDHALDALICALVAGAVMRGETRRPEGEEEVRRAGVEGWIHF